MLHLMDIMRLRLPELLIERDMTPYALVKQAGGRISLSTAYRLNRNKGKVRYLDTELLEALCDVLDCEPGELLERQHRKRK
jgi:DNA-binding Xre family transcriptional regulator